MPEAQRNIRQVKAEAAVNEEIDHMLLERNNFIDSHEPPYSLEEQAQFAELNEMVIKAFEAYYKRQKAQE